MAYLIDTAIPTTTIFLDSANCQTRSPTFKYALSTKIHAPLAVRLLMSVQSISLPNVINNINPYNNSFSYQLGTNYYTITAEVGIYSAWTFASYINDNLSGDLTMTFNPSTFKYSFYSTLSFSIINTSTNPTTCGNVIGISTDANNQLIFPMNSRLPAHSLQLESTVNFIYTPYVSLKMENISVSNMNSSGGMNNTLCRFPINCQYGEIIQYRPTELNRFLISRREIESVEFTLSDSFGNPLSIPSSAELQVILKFEFIHPPIASDLSEGTIAKFYKDNPTPAPDEDEEDDGILGE